MVNTSGQITVINQLRDNRLIRDETKANLFKNPSLLRDRVWN